MMWKLLFFSLFSFSQACFIHIPRSGGLSFRIHNNPTCVWHDASSLPDVNCGTITTLRHPVDRYLSEWNFYGVMFFKKNMTVKGWKPANGFPASFEDFLNDNSTHNSITKILSGCQLYSRCLVNKASVSHIIEKIKSNCLTIVPVEDLKLKTHQNEYTKNITLSDLVRKANNIDLELYNSFQKMRTTV